jgi:MFS family permease
MSRLMLVMGAAPILAPTLGGLLLGAGGWRAIFWACAAYGFLSCLLAATLLPETLPPARRVRRAPAACSATSSAARCRPWPSGSAPVRCWSSASASSPGLAASSASTYRARSRLPVPDWFSPMPRWAPCRGIRRAGSTSALMGTLQFTLAAAGGALVGALMDGTPRPMALLMLLGVTGATAACLARPRR